ncbi:MAG: EAL domain-containing protein [Acidobacteriaceae bacterium]|nr:EAL domain-containing protein [Acidobacteriaceae bacterium]
MNRKSTIAGAVILAVLAAVLPLSVSYYISRTHSIEAEQRHLTEYGSWTIERSSIAVSDAISALHEIDAAGFSDCSEQHIDAMRLTVMNHRAIEEVGFYKNGLLGCTSWGPVTKVIAQRPADYQTADGIRVNMRIHPAVSKGHPVIAFEYKNHNVLVDPSRLVDVLVDNNMSLALANDRGDVLATLNNPDPALLKKALSTNGSGSTRDYLYATYRVPGWVAIAAERQDYAFAGFRRQRNYMLPIAILLACIMIAAIVLVLRRRLSPLAELEIAVRKREFINHYQPIMELATGRCIGAEALVRWRRPDGSLTPPNFFIPLAEESGLIREITDQLIQLAIDEMHAALSADPEMHIAINLCAADIETGRPLESLALALAARRLPTSSIWLEATERGFIHADEARESLGRAQKAGHPIAIDDFGTGYSSLGLLHSLPLDVLKIDKSFVDAIGTDSASSTVTGHIIDIARQLDLEVVAEGIEQQQQADYLRSHGVRYGQGWLFAKAMPRDEFLAFYGKHRRASAA